MSRSNTMVVDESQKEVESSQSTLDFSSKGVTKMGNLPKRTSVSKLILDHNNITKIENLEAFPKLCMLSIAGNQLLRMNGVNFGKNLATLNLSSNGIVSMEGLCWLVHLEHLDLSKNNIKRIQNVSYCTKLKYMDLSENSIEDISDLSSLLDLKVLLLHGNTVTTLQRAEVNLPGQLETLSLAGNHISDLNEMHHLSSLQNIKHFSLLNNPCVISTPSIPGFDYRPFLLFCCPTLMSLDGFVVKNSERNDGEILRSDGNLPLFTFGHHLQLILYLSKVSPVATAQQLHNDQNKFLENFLETQKFSEKEEENGFTLSNGELQNVDECLDEGDVNDLLRSESSFLPVLSPLKKSMEINDGDYRADFDQSWGTQNSSQPTNQEFPIMTEEEAKKLIHLAATILQAHIRGFLVRQKLNYKNFKRIHNAACKIQALWKGYYFRHVSEEGKIFKQELRIRRLQKYVSTLCIMMHRSEEEHELEKQQLFEVVTTLYEKFSQLSDLVEEQNIKNRNEQDKLKRNAAVIIQKHWRGYIVRKQQHFLRIKSNNALESLFVSHIELTKKVKYLESLLMKDKTCDYENNTEINAALLPHPRHLETKQEVEKIEHLTNKLYNHQTEALPIVEISNKGEINGVHHETTLDKERGQEFVKDCLVEDNVDEGSRYVEDIDEDRKSSRIFEEIGDLGSNEERVGTHMDSEGLIVDSKGIIGDSKGLIVDSKGHLVDRKGLIGDSKGLIVDSKGLIVDSEGLLVDSGGLIVDSKGLIGDSKDLLVNRKELVVDSLEGTLLEEQDFMDEDSIINLDNLSNKEKYVDIVLEQILDSDENSQNEHKPVPQINDEENGQQLETSGGNKGYNREQSETCGDDKGDNAEQSETCGDDKGDNGEQSETCGDDKGANREQSETCGGSKEDNTPNGEQFIETCGDDNDNGVQSDTCGGDNEDSNGEQHEICDDKNMVTLETPIPSGEGINSGTNMVSRDHLDISVKAGTLSDIRDGNGIDEVGTSGDTVDNLDTFVEPQDIGEPLDNCNDVIIDESNHEVEGILLQPNTESKQESSSNVEEALDPVRRTSDEITIDVQVSVQHCDLIDNSKSSSSNDEEDNKNGDNIITKQENIAGPTHTADITISPRLGKRASSLLSALKTELTSVSPRASNGEEITPQDTSHITPDDLEISSMLMTTSHSTSEVLEIASQAASRAEDQEFETNSYTTVKEQET